MKITHIGHSAFFVESESGNFLIDPFIKGNPQANFDVSDKKIDAIFVTHAHSDHLGDAIEISVSKGAPIFTTFELANYCARQGATVVSSSIGGKVCSDFADIWFLPAVHSSSTPDWGYGGTPAGVFIGIDGKKIYHTGDTALTQDLKVVSELYAPDVAMVPIGGHFTMGIDEAVIASKWIGAKTIIPMHYNTFPQLQADPFDFKRKVEAQGQKCVVLNPGENLEI